MNIFKKSLSGPVNLFKKVANPVGSFFRKGGIRHIADTTSNTLGQISKGLGNINQTAGKVLDSNVVKGLVNLAGPTGLVNDAYKGAVGLNQSAALASKLANQGSQFSDRKNYNKNTGDVMVNMLERGRKIGNQTAAESRGIKFY